MDRKTAFARVQLWLGVSELIKDSPSISQAHKLANLIYNLSGGSEVYSTVFVYDVWSELRGESARF